MSETYESRVLAVLSSEHWTQQSDVHQLAKMGYEQCFAALRALVTLGVVQRGTLRRAVGTSGRPRILYRRQVGV